MFRLGSKNEGKITVKIITEERDTFCYNIIEKVDSGGLEDEIEVLSEIWGRERATDAVITLLAASTSNSVSD